MTIKKSWLNKVLIVLVSALMLSSCAGKSSKTEESAANAAPVEDITLPPQLIEPSDPSKDEKEADEKDE
jgi:uncharacterized lipoprotein YajG